MRLFGLLGVLLTLAIVGLLVKKQLTSIASPGLMAPIAIEAESAGSPGATTPTMREQSQQIQQQIKQSVEAGMQPRTLPDNN